MKIIDCLIFYNELDLLSYRLNLLNNIVDYFIIVESTHSFVGKEKQLFFNENKHLFENFTDKIIHIVVDDFPHKRNDDMSISNDAGWANEYFQRNSISRGINRIEDSLLKDTTAHSPSSSAEALSGSDVIIISDLDEIPDPNTLNEIKKGNIQVNVNALEMDLYYYNLNTKFKYKWNLCKIISYEKYRQLNLSCNDIRRKNCSAISNGGWHLSYFGDKHFIQNKIQNFSHQEFNAEKYTNLEKIEDRIKNGKDLYDRPNDIETIKIEDNMYLPVDYQIYLNKYYN